jgi:hypothetical protein
MKIHEYLAKAILARHGVPAPRRAWLRMVRLAGGPGCNHSPPVPGRMRAMPSAFITYFS